MIYHIILCYGVILFIILRACNLSIPVAYGHGENFNKLNIYMYMYYI